MSDVRIIPRATNAFDLELTQWSPNLKETVVVGRLEIHTDFERIHILRREGNFADMIVKTQYPNEKLLATTHAIDIELPRFCESELAKKEKTKP